MEIFVQNSKKIDTKFKEINKKRGAERGENREKISNFGIKNLKH